jgi:hypothetical protein
MVIVVEGDTDLPYVRKLVADAKLEITTELDAGGKGNIDRDLVSYNSAGRSMPWVVFRDLDSDAPCGGAFIGALKLRPARWFRLRLAIRELESWVLADATGLSSFIEVDAKWIPSEPDLEMDATASLLNVAKRASAHYRRCLLPARGSTAKVGPLYEATVIEFGERAWSLERAAKRSPSLRRARAALRKLGREWRAFVGQP